MRKGRVLAGFLLLCGLWGSGWILDEAMPGCTSRETERPLHYAVLAVLSGLASVAGRGSSIRRRAWLELAAGGIAMVAIPQILTTAAGGKVSSISASLIFLLVPVVVVFVVAQGDDVFGAGEGRLASMAPALAGLGGAALLFPFSMPASAQGKAWVAAMALSALLAGAAAVRMHRAMAGVPVLRGAAVVFGSAAVAMLVLRHAPLSAGLCSPWKDAETEAVRCFAFDGPIALLSVWLLREMEPAGFSARYLLIPLVAIAESYLLLRPHANWVQGFGVLLMAGGVVGLMKADSREVL